MRRSIFFGCVVLMFILTGSLSYAAMTKTPISPSDLPILKGKWVGSRASGPARTFNTDLEISNEGLPVQGKIIFHDVPLPGHAGVGETKIVNFKNGEINDQGNLLVKLRNFEVELSLYKDDAKMKLEGDYSGTMGSRGTMWFKK